VAKSGEKWHCGVRGNKAEAEMSGEGKKMKVKDGVERRV
jgi:hypothetical protein